MLISTPEINKAVRRAISNAKPIEFNPWPNVTETIWAGSENLNSSTILHVTKNESVSGEWEVEIEINGLIGITIGNWG